MKLGEVGAAWLERGEGSRLQRGGWVGLCVYVLDRHARSHNIVACCCVGVHTGSVFSFLQKALHVPIAMREPCKRGGGGDWLRVRQRGIG